MKLCEEDLRKVVWLSEPVLSPDGRTGAYVRAVSDFRTGLNVPAIQVIDLDARETKPLSGQTKRQFMPRFFPDGGALAFCSDDGGLTRLYKKDLRSSAETELAVHVSDYAISPDGKSVVYCQTLFFDRQGRPADITDADGYAAWRREMEHAPRYTEALMYKLDEAFGFFDSTGTAVVLKDLETGETRVLTQASTPCTLPSFSPDGRSVYWYGRPFGREKALDQAIYCCDIKDGSVRQLPVPRPVSAVMPVTEHNGLPVYAGYCEERGRTELFAFDEQNGTEIPLLPDDGTEGVDPALIGDDRNGRMGSPVQRDGHGQLYYLTARDGKVFVSDTAGNAILSGQCVQGFSGPQKGRVLALKSEPCRPGELYMKDLTTGIETRLTDENGWFSSFEPARPEGVTADFGTHTVHGWTLLPEGDAPCPAVLYIHGGPECFFGEDIFFFEAQSLRAAGFAVLWCNPRGSAGYGPDFAQGAYGQEAVDDLMGFVDACAARFPRIDVKRLGVTGGSYGGYMTNKLTLLTDRFRAAAAQRTWIDPATSYGTGDMGFLSGSGKTDFREYMLVRAKGSVLRDIHRLNTPTLILHGEKDVRCGEEQADQLFNMIRALRPQVPCRLVVFPGENHGLTREGRMHHRIRHMQEIRRWMETYLTDEEKAP